jgi:hypothetical protein
MGFVKNYISAYLPLKPTSPVILTLQRLNQIYHSGYLFAQAY